jgi:hypothetical protein
MLFMDGWIRKLEIEKLMEIKNELIYILKYNIKK